VIEIIHRWLTCFLIIACVGCASVAPEQRQAVARGMAAKSSWVEQAIKTGTFTLMTYQPIGIGTVDTLTVYLEGDGHAWVGGRYPSEDPTPLDPVALRLALAQPKGSAAYLARPCQYLRRENGARCSESVWTRDRFSPDVVESMNQALDQIKVKLGAESLVLVGYSGGARIALELAAKRQDVDQLVAVAGNLDPQSWTDALGLLPLTITQQNGALIDATVNLPQVYFVGERDTVVPPWLTRQFADGYPAGRRPKIVSLPQNAHVCCWVEQWPALWFRVVGR
jgi:dienelactone hydrolase